MLKDPLFLLLVDDLEVLYLLWVEHPKLVQDEEGTQRSAEPLMG
jgi:hypothetical protein